MKLTKMLAAGAATLALLAIPQAPATAAAEGVPAAATAQPATMHPQAVKKLTAAQKKKLRAGWKKYGVKKSVQDKLIKKLEQGKKWNSFTKGAKVKKKKVYNRGGYKVTLRTYADGSTQASEAQIPKKPAPISTTGRFMSASTAGCTYTTGPSLWRATDCIASDNYVLYEIHAVVAYDFRITGGTTGQIESVTHAAVTNRVGGHTTGTPSRVSGNEFEIPYSIDLLGMAQSQDFFMHIKATGMEPLTVTSTS